MGKSSQSWYSENRRNKSRSTLFMAGLLIMPLLGQTPQEAADINKKVADINKLVIGKWLSGNGRGYIEFLADGTCSEAALFPDGTWHVEHGKLGAWARGEAFSCISGVLTLVRPNTLTRDYGTGGQPTMLYRGAQNRPKPETTLTIAVAQRILNEQIDMSTADNTLLTCRACYDPRDKQDNDKAPLVSTYSTRLGQFLMQNGYIRTSGEQHRQGQTKQPLWARCGRKISGTSLCNFQEPYYPDDQHRRPAPCAHRVRFRAHGADNSSVWQSRKGQILRPFFL